MKSYKFCVDQLKKCCLNIILLNMGFLCVFYCIHYKLRPLKNSRICRCRPIYIYSYYFYNYISITQFLVISKCVQAIVSESYPQIVKNYNQQWKIFSPKLQPPKKSAAYFAHAQDRSWCTIRWMTYIVCHHLVVANSRGYERVVAASTDFM